MPRLDGIAIPSNLCSATARRSTSSPTRLLGRQEGVAFRVEDSAVLVVLRAGGVPGWVNRSSQRLTWKGTDER
jgi:hypothetical protein